MKHSLLEELKLFIVEAERLTSRSFYQHFNSGEEIAFSDGSFPENAPTIEQLESYLLHLRKFLQKNDRVCIQTVNQYFQGLAGNHIALLNQWNSVYKDFEELMEAEALTGRVITNIPEIPDLSLLTLFKARTFGDLSHLDSKKQILHQQLSSTDQLDGLYRFEYYNFLFEIGEIIAEMAELCTDLLILVKSQP